MARNKKKNVGEYFPDECVHYTATCTRCPTLTDVLYITSLYSCEVLHLSYFEITKNALDVFH